MECPLKPKPVDHTDELAAMIGQSQLDIRLVKALAGDRTLNAREQAMLERLQEERGEAIFSDILYALTYRHFSAKQARHLWHQIVAHRQTLQQNLLRDVGVSVAAHDYLSNIAGLLSDTAAIEASKMYSLTSVATRDGLTGLVDQATFKHRLKEELERQCRYGGLLSLVMFDIDHFKKINDTLGHAEGDAVIKHLADVLRNQVRKIDTAARYGGEEFAVILPEVDSQPAFIFAERLRQNVAAAFSGGDLPVTISVGVATVGAQCKTDAATLIKQADAALYAAKGSGRNRVCVAETTSAPSLCLTTPSVSTVPHAPGKQRSASSVPKLTVYG